MYISIEQALSIYEGLIDSLNGESFGEDGNEVEIFVYKLLPHSPTYSMNNYDDDFDEENRMIEKKAAEDFHSLCYIFTRKHNADIKIDEVEMQEWISKVRTGEIRFFHKVNVSIINKREKKND
jgi:hypothetical protein